MPIFSYRCRDCGEQFSTLVMSGETPACRACESQALEKQVSLIASPARGGDDGPTMAACEGGVMDACERANAAVDNAAVADA